MDHFGIGSAVKGSVRIYFQSARRTGRTTSLIESVKNGDRIYFSNRQEADRVKRLLRDREISAECVVVDPADPHSAYRVGTPSGRSVFDHTWVEQFYLDAIERCRVEIDRIERETSGFGTAHMETKRAYEEISKWR